MPRRSGFVEGGCCPVHLALWLSGVPPLSQATGENLLHELGFAVGLRQDGATRRRLPSGEGWGTEQGRH